MSDPSTDSDTKPGEDPRLPRPRRGRHRVRRWFVAFLVVAGLLLVLSYTAPVQQWALDSIAARLESQAGMVLRVDRAAFDPIRLRASLDGVSIASRQTPSIPYLTAGHIDLNAPAAVLRGRPVLDRIRITDVSIDMAKVAHGGPDGGPFRGLGSLPLGDG